MTGRTVPEWSGASPDTAIPARVRVRLFEAAKGLCQSCGVRIRPGNGPEYDHRLALILGGENREGNIDVLCRACHSEKSKADVAAKSKTARIRAKHLGVKTSSRPMPGSKASGFRKRMDGRVERREERT
ncbi:HNH endonuclease [Siculibacillus lacustris]|uniref:HNH endonuclease n=1 Tax=Siculibacillus lacustris TaxID=1549641 RepID=A0A4Q9VFQ8_9HYPH|nr:HNH endonuclease signature motif containing protein [Siculibacillus lacustris]TBW33584.1 HNH endonuclease [Siculibacillus lacustris]